MFFMSGWNLKIVISILKTTQNELVDPKGPENVIYTITEDTIWLSLAEVVDNGFDEFVITLLSTWHGIVSSQIMWQPH